MPREQALAGLLMPKKGREEEILPTQVMTKDVILPWANLQTEPFPWRLPG
jgi:hypothetical protein